MFCFFLYFQFYVSKWFRFCLFQILVLVLFCIRMVIAQDLRKGQRLSVRHVGWRRKLWNRYRTYNLHSDLVHVHRSKCIRLQNVSEFISSRIQSFDFRFRIQNLHTRNQTGNVLFGIHPLVYKRRNESGNKTFRFLRNPD